MVLTLSPSQLDAIQVTERVASIFSMLGIFFIFSTFLLGQGFDKPINRLIFFASLSNLGMNIATLISEDGVRAGQHSSLCQFQAFAVQMFLGVDVFWALCMAVNVYLALFRGWTARRMRAQEWKYFIGCYGASFVPAFVYIFVQTRQRGKVYGPAVLWCWIDTEWDFLRIATLYGIVWIAIFFAFIIYTLAFRKVWRQRHQLHGLFNPFNEEPFGHTTVTTEVSVVSEWRQPQIDRRVTDTTPPTALTGAEAKEEGFDPYTVNVGVGDHEGGESGAMRRPSAYTRTRDVLGGGDVPEIMRVRSLTREAALQETNPDAWLYARVAFLFFCALLISWVPSSINRVYSLAHPTRLNFGLNYTEALVLPLQGFWNAVVYIITSQTACWNLYRRLRHRPALPRHDIAIALEGGQGLDAAGGGAGAMGATAPGGKSRLGLGKVVEKVGVGVGGKGGSGRKGDGSGGGGVGGGGGGILDRFVSRRESQRLGDEGSNEEDDHSDDTDPGYGHGRMELAPVHYRV